MKAMILAAGRGRRMQPLSDQTPKPLLQAGKHRLIEWHLLRFAEVGVTDIVINVAYQGQKIMTTLGDGSAFGVKISYSIETETGGLETGGGILQALPLLGEQPFLLVSADIWCDYPWARLMRPLGRHLAHLVMVDNPPYHPQGDFALKEGLLSAQNEPKMTYGNIALISPKLFKDSQPGKYPLAPLLRQAMHKNLVTGEHYQGPWFNVGTPDDLAALRAVIRHR